MEGGVFKVLGPSDEIHTLSVSASGVVENLQGPTASQEYFASALGLINGYGVTVNSVEWELSNIGLFGNIPEWEKYEILNYD